MNANGREWIGVLLAFIRGCIFIDEMKFRLFSENRFAVSLILFGLFAGAAARALDERDEAPQPATNSVVVPSEFRRGRVMVRARVNDSEPLLFMLDSRFTISMISPEQVSALALTRTGKITIVGVAGEEPADVFGGVTFDFGGNLKYSPRRVASLASHSRRIVRRDGVLGEGFYRQFTIEIDHRAKSVVVHQPDTFEYKGSGEVVPLQFRRGTPVLRASILFSNQPPVSGEFEIDTGCDGGLCLGHDFVEQNGLEAKIASSERSARVGVGGGVRTREVRLPQVQIGKLIIERPTADFFEKGSPAGEGLAGHIGVEVLRQFRVIFDYPHRRMIFERPEAVRRGNRE